jgi:hypothetical protein
MDENSAPLIVPEAAPTTEPVEQQPTTRPSANS